MAALDLGKLLQEMVPFALRGSAVSSQVIVHPNLPAIEADAGQLRQVITNLVLNARDAMPEGRLVVRAEPAEWLVPDVSSSISTRCVRVTFQDEGPGMSAAQQARIFDPYFSTKQDGHGLGLSIVYSIMTKHRGAVTVQSTLGAGARFTLLFPVSQREVVPMTEFDGEDEGVPRGEGPVLVMDDDNGAREALTQMLDWLGYDVIATAHGEEAWVAWQTLANDPSRRPRVVLCDLTVVRGYGGLRLARQLRAHASSPSIVLMSGYSDRRPELDEEPALFDAFLQKPFRIETLAKTLHRVLRVSSVDDE